MREKRLGRTNLMVSEIGFGGIPIQRLSDEQSTTLIHRCLDLGVNFFDTAHGYGNSEERIGRALLGRREGLVLATKSPARDAETFREQMELSFRRLAVEHIDLFQFHSVSSEEGYERILVPGGPLDVAREAQAAGRIGHIGVTSHSLDLSLELVRSGHFETLMFPFNFVTSEPSAELIPLCREHDVGFICMKPMAGGLLANARLAFKYLMQVPDIVPIPGIETAAEIEEIVTIVEAASAFTESERQEIDRLREELGNRFCRRCDYCQPCTQFIAISMVMNLHSFARRLPQDTFLGEGVEAAVAKAETCSDCGECEPRCPYGLPVRETIRDNATWYREEMALFHGI